MLRWARHFRALFSTFFEFLGGIGPELALFDPLFAPYACRCDDASARVFSPFPSALLHASAAPDCQNGSGKRGAECGVPPAFAEATAGKIADWDGACRASREWPLGINPSATEWRDGVRAP